MDKLTLIDSGDKTLLKQGRKIVGYIAPAKIGYSYNVGKPSDMTVSSFTKNCDLTGFTKLEAKNRLLEIFNK